MKEIKFTCWIARSWNNSPCEKCGLPEGDDENCLLISPIEPELSDGIWRDIWAVPTLDHSFRCLRISDEENVLRPIVEMLNPKEKSEVEIIVRIKEK